MKLQRPEDNLNLNSVNTADVAYLLLIFIIILSLICTDKIYGVKLPHSECDKPSNRTSVKVMIKMEKNQTNYLIDDILYNASDLEQTLLNLDNECEITIVADKQTKSKEIKRLVSIIQNCNKSKIAFMTD